MGRGGADESRSGEIVLWKDVMGIASGNGNAALMPAHFDPENVGSLTTPLHSTPHTTNTHTPPTQIANP